MMRLFFTLKEPLGCEGDESVPLPPNTFQLLLFVIGALALFFHKMNGLPLSINLLQIRNVDALLIAGESETFYIFIN